MRSSFVQFVGLLVGTVAVVISPVFASAPKPKPVPVSERHTPTKQPQHNAERNRDEKHVRAHPKAYSEGDDRRGSDEHERDEDENDD